MARPAPYRSDSRVRKRIIKKLLATSITKDGIYASFCNKRDLQKNVGVSVWIGSFLNLLSANPTKWSNILTQFVGKLLECV